MFNPGPIHGQPIHGVGDLADMALSANQMAQQALGANIQGMHSQGGGNSLAMVPPFKHNFKCFRICSCWKRQHNNALGGQANGCYWMCEAIEVIHWWDWISAGESPNSHWEQLPQNHPQDYRTPIWWVTQNSRCCCPPPSEAAPLGEVCYPGAIAPPSNCGDVPESNWQGDVPPRFGIGDYVWCIYEYSSGYWRILDAQDNIVPFILHEPMIGCHSVAMAALIQYECCEGEGCDCGGSATGDCDACSPSSCPPPSSCNSKPPEAREARLIQLYDPLGIVNVQFGRHGLDQCEINELDCAIQCSIENALKLTAEVTSHQAPPVSSTTCVSVPKDVSIDCDNCELVVEYDDLCITGVIPGTREWNAHLCTNLKELLTIGLRLYTRELSDILNRQQKCDMDRTAPTGTFGWAKWNSQRRRWEVVSYGCCPCDECQTSSSSCQPHPVTSSCSSTCGSEVSSCAFMNWDTGSHVKPPRLEWGGNASSEFYPMCSYEGIVIGSYIGSIDVPIHGKITGTAKGSAIGEVHGHVHGSAEANVHGSAHATVLGSVAGSISGPVSVNVTGGTATGTVSGTAKANVHGSAEAWMHGTATTNVHGDATATMRGTADAFVYGTARANVDGMAESVLTGTCIGGCTCNCHSASGGRGVAADSGSGVVVVGGGERGISAGSGDCTGSCACTCAGDVSGYANGRITGSAHGDITGYAEGPITGNATGPIVGYGSGAIVGLATGPITGSATGPVTGNVSGPVSVSVTGGHATGHVSGTARGSAHGPITGHARGSITGKVSGSAHLDITTEVTASVTGHLKGPGHGTFIGKVKTWCKRKAPKLFASSSDTPPPEQRRQRGKRIVRIDIRQLLKDAQQDDGPEQTP